MLYLNDRHIVRLGMPWSSLVNRIEETAALLAAGDYVQPLKPYLRFNRDRSRIIAMPSYVGGRMRTAGLKWIASFPDNWQKGLPRAHAVFVLNDAGTGRPRAICCSGKLSAIRTAAVSGAMLRAYVAHATQAEYAVAIAGFGPIGQLQLAMCAALLGERLTTVYLSDPRGIDQAAIPEGLRSRVCIEASWQTGYRAAELFFACTTAAAPYIDEQPGAGKLIMNISLRDFKPEAIAHVRPLIVDDWTEVCREGTDVERLHQHHGLMRENTVSLAEVVCEGALAKLPAGLPVFFNPMGMAVFDMAIADYYVGCAAAQAEGVWLEE